MKNKAILKRSLMYLLALVFLFGTVQANESVSSFEQSVPFGVAHTEDGSNIPVFKKPSSKKATAELYDFQICAVVSTERLSGNLWYRINYFDDSGVEQSGYVRSENFYQLTVAGLVSAMADPDIAAYMQYFSGLELSAFFVDPETPQTRSVAASATERPTVTEAPRSNTVTYVLNTNTKKFHYPYCSSVNAIKDKNRRDFTGTREEVIQMGYEPCGRCHP